MGSASVSTVGMSDLNGPRHKVERAKKHILDLIFEKDVFLASNPYKVTPKYYAEDDVTGYFIDSFTATPPAISLIAGDAAHNLRSALDLLACVLVGRGGGRAKSGLTYFPICKTAKLYEAEAGRKIDGMSPADKKAISLLKPYGGGNDLLWGLHRLDIIDKHRLLLTPVICVPRVGITIDTDSVERAFHHSFRFADRNAIKREILWELVPTWLLASKVGDPVLSVKGNRELHQDVELTFDIALSEPEVFKGRPILETLHELADLVSGIVDAFELR